MLSAYCKYGGRTGQQGGWLPAAICMLISADALLGGCHCKLALQVPSPEDLNIGQVSSPAPDKDALPDRGNGKAVVCDPAFIVPDAISEISDAGSGDVLPFETCQPQA